MDDDRNELFGGMADEDDFDVAYDQDGPDLFGTEPDELVLPSEPVSIPDPDMDLPMDSVDEIPIDPEEYDDPDEGAYVDPKPDTERPEAPLALYRRYRPDTFVEVIGQDHVTEPLQRALTNNRVNHAYLFSGPRGCGKTTSARILARCLNCATGPTPTPCGKCQSCQDLARGGTGSIDVIEIDAASHGGVDEARDLRERAFFAPVHSRYKIYIIDEAHMVTSAGFNALLKVVEEPPAHVKFIFATTEPEKVIGTIRSRTHHYPFRLVPPKTLTNYLGRICVEEGVAIEPSVLPLVVRAGAGSVRDSLSVLDQLLGGSGAGGVQYAQAAALLGYTPDTLLDEIMDAFAVGEAEGVFACIDKVIEVGQDPRRFAEDLLRRLRDLILVAAVPDALSVGLVDVAPDQAERLATQASGMGPGELTRAAEVIARGLTEMRGTTAPRLHLELMCARVLLPGADVDARGIHARLDRLERRLLMQPGDVPAVSDVGRPRVTPPVEPVGRGTPDADDVSGCQMVSGRQKEQPDAAPTPPVAPEPRVPKAPEPTPQPAERAPEPRVPKAPEPTPEPAERAPEPRIPKAAKPAPAPAASASSMDAAGVRSLWPQVLEAVSRRRRVIWIVLRENAQVQHFEENSLTMAVDNVGAHGMFVRTGGVDVLRESLLEVMGIAPNIEVVLADGSQAKTPSQQSKDPKNLKEAKQPEARPAEAPNPYIEQARRNVEATKVVPDEPTPEEEPDRNDTDLDSNDVDVDELIVAQLGAELITEEEPPNN